jgi:hypothetical protein
MNANGPAIKGGCVTRREHRAESWYFSREMVTVQDFYYVLMSVSGCNKHYEFVLEVGANCRKCDKSTYLYCPCYGQPLNFYVSRFNKGIM